MTAYTPLPARRPGQPKTYPVCSLKKAMEMIETRCGDVSIRERHGQGFHKVIILPEAARELDVMISYGRRSPMNAKEQKYVGYGHFMKDEKGRLITIVKHYIEIQTMNRSAVSASNLGPGGEYNPGLDFLEYHREEFLKNEARYNTDASGNLIDPFLRLCGPSEFVQEGHTHPDLGVFFSGADKVSGSARAASSPVCIFVCDPVRKKMLGSVGKNFAEAEVIVYSYSGNAKEDYYDDERLTPSANEIARLASQCICAHGYAGDIKVNTLMDGRMCLKIKLLTPREKG